MEDLEHSYDVTLEALGDALDLKDSETEGHSKRVTAYAIALARAPKCSCKTCRIRRMDSLSVGIQGPSINCDGGIGRQVNTDLRDDLLPGCPSSQTGWPGSVWNGGRDQIGTVAAI